MMVVVVVVVVGRRGRLLDCLWASMEHACCPFFTPPLA